MGGSLDNNRVVKAGRSPSVRYARFAGIVAAGLLMLCQAIAAQAAPRDELLFIFNHGSSNHFGFDCYLPVFHSRPKWLTSLDGQTVDGKTIRVVTPCTGFEAGGNPDVHGCNEVWVCNRAIKIAEIIQDYRSRGYPARNIFVGGHSAGGWSSLLIKRWKPDLFNGVIAIAPAFNGARTSRTCVAKNCKTEPDRLWNIKYRQQHERHLGTGSDATEALRALIFTFPCDPYARPTEVKLDSITYPVGVDTDPACAKPSKERKFYLGKSENGKERPRCNDAPNLLGTIIRNGLWCGSGNKKKGNNRTYGMLLGCTKENRKYCDRNQHSSAHRSEDFRDYIVSSGVVLNFIREKYENWQTPPAVVAGKTPCSFIDFPKECPKYPY